LLEFRDLKRPRGLGEATSGSWSWKDSRTVLKKLLVVVVLGISAFAVWRKLQADRAELNLWTEATTADD
jgi:hypothetical protein